MEGDGGELVRVVLARHREAALGTEVGGGSVRVGRVTGVAERGLLCGGLAGRGDWGGGGMGVGWRGWRVSWGLRRGWMGASPFS